jgi:SPP1 gp7 family putative phage head morphogenesis protein
MLSRSLSPLGYALSRISDRFLGGNVIFGPGQPLAPLNADPAPRQFQYPVAINLSIQPRRDIPNLTAFETLRYLAKKHPLAALCIRVRAQQIMALEGRVVATHKQAQAAEQGTCDALNQFFRKPDGAMLAPAWTQMLVRDILEIDAPTIYKRPSRGGGLYGLEVIDGSTIKPVLDARGRTVAYQQVLYGLPLSQYLGRRVGMDESEVIGEFAPGELWYQPYSPQTASPYGRPAMEDMLELAWTMLKKIDFDLGHFTDGNIPGALAVLDPANGSQVSPDQVGTFEDNFNAALQGDTQRGHKLKFIPFPMKVERLQQLSTGGQYESAFEERMVKLVCALYGLTPAEVGFTEDVNKSSGDSQENVQYRIGIKPFARWMKLMVYDPVIQVDLGQPQCEWQYDYGESEDRARAATTEQGDIAAGVITAQESRMRRYPDLGGQAPGPPAAPGEPPATSPLAMVAKRADDEPDDAAERLEAEEAVSALLGVFFAAQLGRLRRAVREQDGAPSADFWPAEQALLLRALLPQWDAVAGAAAEAALTQIPIGVDWGGVNQAVLQLARREAAALAATATATSQAQAAQIIADWIADGGTLDELAERLARIYPEARAKTIAATEVTRLYAAGNREAWRASKVVKGYTWRTSEDARVCPICGPRANQSFGLDDATMPPAHPNCRCWIVPEVMTAEEMNTR